MKSLKWNSVLSALLVAAITMTACVKSDQEAANEGKEPQAPSPSSAPEVTNKPVELTIWATSMPPASFEKITGQIKRKYPNFSFKLILESDLKLPDAVASNTNIDILFGSLSAMPNLITVGMNGDIADLIKKHNFDLNRLSPQPLEMMKKMNDGKLFGLPLNILNMVMFYNKDLFDKFGEAPPKDGMTWEDTYELAKKMTRADGGVQYRGFTASRNFLALYNQRSLELIDPKTKKAAFGSEPWRLFINTIVPFYTISPGYQIGEAPASFLKGSVAMEANLNSNYPNDNPFNWDVVSLPTFKDLPGVAGQPGPTYLTVSTTSKHRDEAFLSIAQMLSEEVQLERSKDGSVTVLNNFKSAIDVFGQNAPALKGKNVKAITPTKMAEPAVFSKYNTIAQNEISSLIMRVATGEKDLNTALRESAEAIDKQIQADLAK